MKCFDRLIKGIDSPGLPFKCDLLAGGLGSGITGENLSIKNHTDTKHRRRAKATSKTTDEGTYRINEWKMKER